MAFVPEELAVIAKKVRAGNSIQLPVRAVLGWFGAQRRGVFVLDQIRSALRQTGLVTDPEIEAAFIDDSLRFLAATSTERPGDPGVARAVATEAVVLAANQSGAPEPTKLQSSTLPQHNFDPISRIGKLASANRSPLSISPSTSLSEAITRMLANDYSQLPVMTDKRTVKGVVSWMSIGSRLALGQHPLTAQECMEDPQVVSSDESLFAVIDKIVKHAYVLVKDKTGVISGIVTGSDLAIQFGVLAEPFLLLGEIENHVRRILGSRFTNEELKGALDPRDSRTVNGAASLTFGEHVRVLQKRQNWDRLGLSVDQKVFVDELDRVRRIRNDVMHFDPDGIQPDDLDALRRFLGFLEGLRLRGAS
jgi:CBS domain-containing protein